MSRKKALALITGGIIAMTTTATAVPATNATATPIAIASREETRELIEVRKIWDKAPHNAFTDLIRFKDHWYCAFREGSAHRSNDGKKRAMVCSG